ncbi:4Fe-4S binding protein [candidate division WOR-3 bacterium]|nr:4Fe-4S binding protein [candidate division WOR-3 bacterium]
MSEAKKIDWKGVDDMPEMAVSLSTMRVNKTASWRNLKPIIDYDKCKPCGICWKFCPEPAILLKEDGSPVIDYDYCKGCGICVEECPRKAITMHREER